MDGRILGIDYGQKRVGLALSDPLGIFASPLQTLVRQSDKKLTHDLVALIAQHDVRQIVLGLPKRTTGELGTMAHEVQAFGSQLAELTGLPVAYEDERFTSTIANQALREQGISASRNKGLVDQTAAALILQQYLDKRAR